jgi:AcrR family transcriptional regulator
MGIKDSSTEQRILEAAKSVFMDYGLYGARMQDIADKAEINKALLHYYFRSKEKLFDAVFEGALQKYFDQIGVMSDISLPIVQRIHQYIDNIFKFYEEYPQMSMFIIKEIQINPELFKVKVEKFKKDQKFLMIPSLKKAMEEGEIAEFNPVIFLINLHSLCAYPFLGAPLFKAMMKKAGHKWDNDTFDQVKESVKEFVSIKLSKK